MGQKEKAGLVADVSIGGRAAIYPRHPTSPRHPPAMCTRAAVQATLNVLTNPFGKYHDHKMYQNGGRRKDAAEIRGSSTRSVIRHKS